jgi:hypothetical protein
MTEITGGAIALPILRKTAQDRSGQAMPALQTRLASVRPAASRRRHVISSVTRVVPWRERLRPTELPARRVPLP